MAQNERPNYLSGSQFNVKCHSGIIQKLDLAPGFDGFPNSQFSCL